jgi:hypothetical protein
MVNVWNNSVQTSLSLKAITYVRNLGLVCVVMKILKIIKLCSAKMIFIMILVVKIITCQHGSAWQVVIGFVRFNAESSNRYPLQLQNR